MAKTSESGLSTIARDEFTQLCDHYIASPIVIYTGAGVSRTPSGLGIGDWDEMLRSLVKDQLGVARLVQYDATVAAKDPWFRAGWIAGHLGSDGLRDAIHDMIRAPGTFQAAYPGLLRRPFVRAASTLRAVAAFSVSLAGYSTSAQGRHYPRVSPNPRVPAILTTNYDPYLEAAASSMFRSLTAPHPLKPIGAVGSSAGLLGQTPVFHLHGYVPPVPSERYEPFVDPVLTEQAYEAAWENRADSYTIGPQIHLLRHYTALFVGFSFRDRWVNELLRQINGERESARALGGTRPYHYAFVAHDDLARNHATWFEELGIRPLVWNCPCEISDALGELYRAGVSSDIRVRGSLELVEYTTTKPHGSKPTGFSRVISDPDAARHLWSQLEGAWHSPLGASPPGRRHRI